MLIIIQHLLLQKVTIIEHLKIHSTGKMSDFLTALSIPLDDKRLRKRVSKVLDQMYKKSLIDYLPKKRWTKYRLGRVPNVSDAEVAAAAPLIPR